MSGPLARMLSEYLGFDLNIYPGRQIQLGKGIYRPRRGSINVQEAFVRVQLELLTGLLVYMRRTQYGEDLLLGRQRNGSCYHGTGASHGFNDLFCGFIHQVVIVRL